MDVYREIKQIIQLKSTNVILSADFTNTNEILSLVDQIGHDLLGVKLHSDIIEDVSPQFYQELLKLKEKHNLIIIEDRKFCDIGNTVRLQSQKICKYADLITVHAISGEGILKGLRNNCEQYNCGILLIAEMSSSDNLIDKNYTNKVVKMANHYEDIVVGFICQSHLSHHFCTLHLA